MTHEQYFAVATSHLSTQDWCKTIKVTNPYEALDKVNSQHREDLRNANADLTFNIILGSPGLNNNQN